MRKPHSPKRPLDNYRYNDYYSLVARKPQSATHSRELGPQLEEQAFVAVLRTADALARKAGAVLKPSGLSATQYNVLRILRGAGAEGLA